MSGSGERESPSRELERLRAENEALKAQLAGSGATDAGGAPFLRSVLAAVPAFIARVAPDLSIRFVNRLQPGLTMEDVVGKTVLDFTDPRYHKTAIAAFERIFAGEEIARYEVIGDGPRGEPRHYETIVTPVSDPGHEAAACIVAFDVTDRQSGEDLLRESQARLAVAVGATGIGLWSWNPTTDEVIWDDRMKAICGLDEPISFPLYSKKLVHAEDRARVELEGRQALESGTLTGTPHRILRADGETRWILSTGTVHRDRHGVATWVLGGSLDVTAQRATEDQLRHAQKMEAVGNLTAGVAHNFNNMLMAILPVLELLRDVVPETHQDLADDAAHAGHRAAEMVRQLMTFAGHRRGGRRVPQRLGHVVDRALGMCSRTFARHITLQSSVEEGTPGVDCDAGEMEQVLVNLLLNARDAVSEHSVTTPRIDVRVDSVTRVAMGSSPGAPAQTYVRVAVSDRGVGMSDAVRARVFEPFFTTKPMATGTGLGLSTCYAIVREHGGWIECDSVPGSGTTFSVLLPSVSTLADGDAPAHHRTRSGPALRVLVVDDEETVRRVATRILEAAGHHVTAAADGEAALQALAEDGGMDIVLLDRSMPGAPGDAYVSRIRAHAPGAKILYFTGQDMGTSDTSAVDGVVAKPVSPDRLVAAIIAAHSS